MPDPRHMTSLDLPVAGEVNYLLKKLRMEVNEKIDCYWELANKATEPAQKAEFTSAAEFLTKLHQGPLSQRFSPTTS